MAISRDQVTKTATLAHMRLGDDEVERFTEQLSNIIDYMDQLNELDTSDVPPMSHATLGEDVERTWRGDAVRPSLGQDLATANAPDRFHGYFKVPSVISRSGTESNES